jgi:hypothetical protein
MLTIPSAGKSAHENFLEKRWNKNHQTLAAKRRNVKARHVSAGKSREECASPGGTTQVLTTQWSAATQEPRLLMDQSLAA